MRLLLDTCVFLWSADEVRYLSPAANAALSDQDNEIVLHQVSVLEIQIKHGLGKLALKLPPADFVPRAEASLGTIRHALDDAAIFLMGNLPAVHKDPFDRILIAHAIYHGLTLVTPDPDIHRYPVKCLW